LGEGRKVSRHSDLLSFLPSSLLPFGLCVSASLREVILVVARLRQAQSSRGRAGQFGVEDQVSGADTAEAGRAGGVCRFMASSLVDSGHASSFNRYTARFICWGFSLRWESRLQADKTSPTRVNAALRTELRTRRPTATLSPRTLIRGLSPIACHFLSVLACMSAAPPLQWHLKQEANRNLGSGERNVNCVGLTPRFQV
jgi:hypothetical protein